MAKARVFQLLAIKDSGWTALARIQNPDGNNILQGSITSISVIVKDEFGTATHMDTLTKADVVFDTLQGVAGVDSRWTVDEIGYNFLHELPASAFPIQRHYRVEFVFEPTAGENYPLIYEGVAMSHF